MFRSSEAEAEALLRKNYSIEEVCERLRMSEFDVRAIAINKLRRWVQSEDRRGREDLRKYIVAIRHVEGAWPESDALRRARKDYDEGRVELAQGRDGLNIILYALPRRTQAKRTQAWFAPNPYLIRGLS